MADNPSCVLGVLMAAPGPAQVDECVEFHVICLTSGAWPVSSAPASTEDECALPRVLDDWRGSFGARPHIDATPTALALPMGAAQCGRLARFITPAPSRGNVGAESFYGESFGGRKLQWLHHLSKVELQYRPPGEQGAWQRRDPGAGIELTASLSQAALLLLFDDAETLKLDDACESLGLDRSTVQAVVGSLESSGLLVADQSSPELIHLNREYDVVTEAVAAAARGDHRSTCVRLPEVETRRPSAGAAGVTPADDNDGGAFWLESPPPVRADSRRRQQEYSRLGPVQDESKMVLQVRGALPQPLPLLAPLVVSAVMMMARSEWADSRVAG